ncbi:unnamed protein product [Brassica napus]|uniref:(rape) hypothetical protein n=1 Tax=Brassica napus TaxID=3708 RepID=A0A816YHA2_BRANA|nr:unnamed protein product [Brassica napus]
MRSADLILAVAREKPNKIKSYRTKSGLLLFMFPPPFHPYFACSVFLKIETEEKLSNFAQELYVQQRTYDFLKFLFQGIKNIMPRILLGSNLLKVTVSSCIHLCCLILINHQLMYWKGVSWGGLKGSVIFALGFHSHGVLFPNPERVLQEATESLAQAESLSGEYYAQLDELIENKKVLDEALQLYLAGLAELEELKEAKGL